MNIKGWALALTLALAAGSACAQSPLSRLSAGAGSYFTSDLGGGYKGGAGTVKAPYAGGGVFVYFDAVFIEVSLGFMGAGGAIGGRGAHYTGLDISLLGKYPFTRTERLTLFPLWGIDYRFITSASGYGGYGHGAYSALWFKLGGGADYVITDRLYARAALLYGFRASNRWEKDAERALHADARLGHGLDIRLAVGYRFWHK